METSNSNKWAFYLGTLVIELITGLFRVLLIFPLVLLMLVVVELVLAKLGIQILDANRAYFDQQYNLRVLSYIGVIAVILAYLNVIASVVAVAGLGGGSLMTRFVLGARKPSTREREKILQVFEQMAEGVDFPINSYSKLYVIDSILEFANLIGTTLYVSSASFRGNNLQALIAHEFGHLNNGDGSMILALRRLVFPPFSLFIGGIRDFSTNRPAYKPGVKEFDAIQIFYSMINNIIFFTLAFIGGGIGVWVMSWAWASYFRVRDYLADSFAAGLGYRDLLLSYLEANIYFDTSIPYMLGWHPAAELRIDALQHPDLYGLPVYDDVPAAAAAGAAFAPLSDVEPAGERVAGGSQVGGQNPSSNRTLRNIVTVAIILAAIYAVFRAWPSIQVQMEGLTQSLSSIPQIPPGEPDQPSQEATAEEEEPEELPVPTATIAAVVSEPTSEPYDCLTTVSASRGLRQYGTGETCWLKLEDGITAVLEFNDEVQVTYRKASGGDDVYFYMAGPGDKLTGVVGATIRPMPFVIATYGGLQEVKSFEVDYHSPGGQWLACLWDANSGQGLTAECTIEEVEEPVEEPAGEALDSLIAAEVITQMQLLGYSTATEFAEAWGLQIGPDKANGEVDPGEIATCPGEVNGCVLITRETNASGNVEWAFSARNPTSCDQNGYRRVPGEGAQTGVPANFDGLLEGVTIRRCQEPSVVDEPEIGAVSSEISLAGWVVCWHGRAEHEFLVAYPEAEARNGIDLGGKVTRRPWDDQDEDLANDSLKMCYYDGNWYGYADSAWFPSVSYLQLVENQMIVCEHSPACSGTQWQMASGSPAPMQLNSLVPEAPQNGIQLLTYWAS